MLTPFPINFHGSFFGHFRPMKSHSPDLLASVTRMLLMLAKLRRTREFEEVLQRMDEEALLRESGETGKVFGPCTGSGQPRVYRDRT